MRLLKYLLALIVLAALVAGAAVYFGVNRVYERYKGYETPDVFVEVPSGAGPATIGERLVAAGVVRDEVTFRGAVWMSGRARELKAGEYQFDQPMTPLEVIDKIARGDVYRRRITFREGLTVPEMAAVYEQSGLGSAADFLEAAADPSPVEDLDPDARDLEGYLFPETYALPRETPASVLVAQMVGLFHKALTPAVREGIKSQGLTVREAVTVASLVEKETSLAAERPVVAAVYLNRKRLGMPMQADPTVIYAMQQAGRWDGNIRREDLQIDSPYNTYRYPGLPPGPIASPGRASLEAVANPAESEYLYFVSRNDGSHVFARTLAEHNRNVREWQIEYFRRQRQQGKQ
ncbi:MAG TPA: endolytic transglycosylase MltG [Vicinamibacterales bacterium]|nr:endolytic transglycosylase MltG [Vicinamibacterales bacterium]